MLNINLYILIFKSSKFGSGRSVHLPRSIRGKVYKEHWGWVFLISLPFCIILQLSIQLKKEALLIISEPLPLEVFKAHSNSNYTVDGLKMGHPTQLIKTLLCNLPLEETRTACTNISTRSTSLREDSTHLWVLQSSKSTQKDKGKIMKKLN